jgi:PAS domain S-box-containing protein
MSGDPLIPGAHPYGRRADDLPEHQQRALDRRVAAVVERMSDASLALGPDWRVTYANAEAARLNGTTPPALVGRDHRAAWPETVGSEVERQYRRAAAERVAVAFEHHYERAGVWHDIRAYPADDGGLAIFFRDISPQKRLEAERARQAQELADAHDKAIAAETQFRLLVDRVRDYAVFVLDPDGIITHWGEGARRMKGWEPEEAVGMHLRRLYPNDGAAEDGSVEEHLRHAIEHGEYIGEGHRLKKNGELFFARVCLTALRRGGRLVGLSKITQDLTLEHERERALQDAMRAAQAASVAKSQFLANTSHEIRTPLNAVIGYAELLDVGLAGSLNEQQRQYVGRIRSTSNHLLSLINDVLDLSRIEAGQMRAASEPGLVRDAVTAAIQLVEPQLHARGVLLANGCLGPSDLAYRGDPERVRQILVNLLSNAIRFTEPGGRVTITCGAAPETPFETIPEGEGQGPGWIFVRVEDTGVGIAADQLGRIWEAFVQVDASRTRKTGGSGRGLTISRHLARLMGGDITVRSTPGLGSGFVVWLPAAEKGAPVREEGADSRVAGDLTRALERRDSPEAVLAEVGGSPRQGLSAVSDALLGEAERMVATHVARLRADPETPSAQRSSGAELEDHLVTFLTDVAQCLTVAGEDGPAARLMLRDGSSIQQLIARRHGVQRAALGWRESELRRELRILREELHAAVGRHVGRSGEGDAERGLGLVNHLLDAAEAEALDAFRGAR